MSSDRASIRQAVRQFVETDRLFGLTEVPIAMPVRQARKTRTSQPASSGASTEPTDKAARLRVLDEGQVKGCTRCRLHEGRTNTVFGVGSPQARLVFVGEGPGFEEDRQGIPFVGRAGQLLTKMIAAMGLAREDVYICNIVKCRPPNNRDPASDEIAACRGYLYEQLLIIDPQVIVALGAPASKTLLETTEGIGRLRGRFHDFQIDQLGQRKTIPLMPTYHPAFLLRSPGQKIKAWEDLQQVMAMLKLPVPNRG